MKKRYNSGETHLNPGTRTGWPVLKMRFQTGSLEMLKL